MNDRAIAKRRAYEAAAAEIEATCSRHKLTPQDRLELMAELSARTAYTMPGRRYGWQNVSSTILEMMQQKAAFRLHYLIGSHR
ncbi:hypothetical protein [Asaia sp. HN010]|uniref:hypothetical protein n=1 Tax=Asaia sp. HN010 TaxID=3081233 RepID=UPI003017310C